MSIIQFAKHLTKIWLYLAKFQYTYFCYVNNTFGKNVACFHKNSFGEISLATFPLLFLLFIYVGSL